MPGCAVSVIVAAFNVARYIEDCLNSLRQQSLEDIEIIAINDGSTDDTLARLYHLRTRFPGNMRVITQRNYGVSAVRNAGISDARGRYIGFVDGDDWVSLDMYRALFAGAEQHRADVAICNGVMVEPASGHTQPFPDQPIWRRLLKTPTQLFDPRKTPDLFCLDVSACRRLYNAGFLRRSGLRFAEGFAFEDVPAHFETLCRTSRVLLIDQPFYQYRVGHPGRATDRTDRRLLQVIEMLLRVIATLEEYKASPALWANFIWYQDWLLRWLGGQIDAPFADEFAQEACRIAGRFPAAAVAVFGDKFRSDELAQAGVNLQVAGHPPAYLAHLRRQPA